MRCWDGLGEARGWKKGGEEEEGKDVCVWVEQEENMGKTRIMARVFHATQQIQKRMRERCVCGYERWGVEVVGEGGWWGNMRSSHSE